MKLNDAARGAIYDHHMFIVQATEDNDIHVAAVAKSVEYPIQE